jgi:hypothetical protein
MTLLSQSVLLQIFDWVKSVALWSAKKKQKKQGQRKAWRIPSPKNLTL